MTSGLEQFRNPRDFRLDLLLMQPLAGDAGTYFSHQRGGEI
jgi:hypothetical protein